MAEAPWLTLVGLGEDGPEGLAPASRAALDAAEVVFGPARHLSLLGPIAAETRTWPVPFAAGIPDLMALRGRRVVVLASGDPFWFGAGTTLTRILDPREWRAYPGVSSFSLAASALGWALESCHCLGLHAAPLTRLRPHLHPGQRILATLRDGAAVERLTAYLAEVGFGASPILICEALGGPRARIGPPEAGPFAHPLLAAIEVEGPGPSLPLASGRADTFFDHDGQITKRPVRALALSALAPCPGERLWDIGGGSGSIAIEWLLAHPSLSAVSLEPKPERAARIAANARALGVDRLEVVEGQAPEALTDLPRPDAVFIGGGLSQALLDALPQVCPRGTRIVAHAVTLESEALLTGAQASIGGTLMRIALSQAQPLGPKMAWSPSYPLVQWVAEL